jgi:hypothetical protein
MGKIEEGVALNLELANAQLMVLLDATKGQIAEEQHLMHKLTCIELQQCQLPQRPKRSNIVGGEVHVSS